MDGAMHALVSFLAQPLFSQLVEVCPTIEGPIADKEMVLDVADHALVFAFGASAVGAAGARCKAVVRGEVKKALIELETVTMVEQHSDFLIVHQHLFGKAAEVLEAADETLVGMFGVEAGGT